MEIDRILLRCNTIPYTPALAGYVPVQPSSSERRNVHAVLYYRSV
jgi:hypothetical protein